MPCSDGLTRLTAWRRPDLETSQIWTHPVAADPVTEPTKGAAAGSVSRSIEVYQPVGCLHAGGWQSSFDSAA
jgi:hypothetical protein